MKRFSQGILLLSFFMILHFTYNKYFIQKNKTNYSEITNTKRVLEIKNIESTLKEDSSNKTDIKKNTNNLIKNLNYELKLSDDKSYIISSELNELTYIDTKEIIFMKNVKASFIEKKNFPLIIIANEAIFDSSTNNTNFKKNVKISYLDKNIVAEKVDVNFIKNTILIYGSTLFTSSEGIIKSDNIKIDLNTKDVFMFMNNSVDKIQIKSN